MEAYTNFAEVYDTFMDNVPYEQWAAYIKETLKEDGIADGLVLELGCGTGSMTERLAEAGYDMIGVDNSADMLEIALDKREKSGQDILYLLQDMREFELYGTVRAIISACDCVNYVTEDEDLLQVFRLVNNYLDPEGLFLFDFNTRYKYETVLGEQVIAEDREDCSFIWDNYYDQEAIRCQVKHIGTVGYVANSTYTVAVGTKSAGRIAHKVKKKFKVQVMFVAGNYVICKVVDGLKEKKEHDFELDKEEENFSFN